MKSLFIPIILLVLTAPGINAQTESKTEQATVERVITDLFDGLAALDINKIKAVSTEDFMLLENGTIWNLDTLNTMINQLKAGSFNRTNHLNFIRTEITTNTAWVAYNNSADMNINGKRISFLWLESAFLIKKGNDWKIKMLHSTIRKT